MKVSIITVCFNAAETIKSTIESISSQSYKNIEHIIIDGGSTDGTREIVSKSDSVSRYIFEPDDGIYDAMNKGLSLATGELIGILNADDFYSNDQVITQVVKLFETNDIDACYSDLVYVQQDDVTQVTRYWKSNSFKNGAFLKGWMPPHPTFFCRKSVYERYGKFDLKYKIAADVEILFRFLEKCNIRSVYLPKVLVQMRMGGKTNQSLENIKVQNQEILSFLDEYYGRISRIKFFGFKICNRFSQYLKGSKSNRL